MLFSGITNMRAHLFYRRAREYNQCVQHVRIKRGKPFLDTTRDGEVRLLF